MQMKIAERINELRRSRGLTQEQLGARLGISGQAVSKWEKGESMPDILLLPELCGILGISVDALLGQSKKAQAQEIMQDFVEYARQHGRNQTLLDALSRLFNDSGANAKGWNQVIGRDTVRVCGEGKMGFIISGTDMLTQCMSQNSENIAYFLQVLADVNALAVIKSLAIDKAYTEKEIGARTGLSEDTLDHVLLMLMKRGIICFDVDDDGKHGYLWSSGIVGVCMALMGCLATSCGTEPRGNLWFTRRNCYDA